MTSTQAAGRPAKAAERATRPPPAGRQRYLQNSFMSKDAMQMMKFRDLTDHYADGWSFVELLMPGVADPTWFDRWKEGLAKASGCVVLFSDAYRKKANTHPQSALRMEAGALRERIESALATLVSKCSSVGLSVNATPCSLLASTQAMRTSSSLLSTRIKWGRGPPTSACISTPTRRI